MDAKESAELIDKAGGTSAFGRLLGVDSGEGWQQRVNNWKRRGIPSDVILEHYDTIKRLKRKLQ